MQKRIGTIFFLFIYSVAIAQTRNCLDLGAIESYSPLKDSLYYFSDFSGNTSIAEITPAWFTTQGQPAFKDRNLNGNHYLLLCVRNSSADSSFLLYLGRAQHAVVYEVDSSHHKRILDNKVKYYSRFLMNQVPYYNLKVPSGEQRIFIIQLKLTFYNWQQLEPVLLPVSQQLGFEFDHILRPSLVYVIVTLILLGIMFSMFVETLMLFVRSGKREYLFCSSAIFIFFVYFALRLLNVFAFSSTYYFFYDLRYQLLQLSGNMLLLFFIASFLKLKENFPVLHRMFKIAIWAQIVFLLINIPLTYTNRFNYIGNTAFDLIRMLVLLYSVYLIVALLKSHREKEAVYLGVGSLLAISLSVLALTIDRWSGLDYLVIRNGGIPVQIFMVGVLLQSFLFLQALSYRSRKQEAARVIAVEQLQLENDRKELEKYRAIVEARENERNRISREIHDDIGSGLTSIRLVSEIAKAKNSPLITKELDKISSTASSLMDKMNEIIWSLNSRNDTLPNLLAYLRHQVVEYFEPLHIQLSLSIPGQVPEVSISGKIRRNILMCVQEALNNIIKHSQATEVRVEFAVSTTLEITIRDNGVGFDGAKVHSFSNGLHNMKHRLQAVGGTCDISNHDGTSVLLKVPLSLYPV